MKKTLHYLRASRCRNRLPFPTSRVSWDVDRLGVVFFTFFFCVRDQGLTGLYSSSNESFALLARPVFVSPVSSLSIPRKGKNIYVAALLLGTIAEDSAGIDQAIGNMFLPTNATQPTINSCPAQRVFPLSL